MTAVDRSLQQVEVEAEEGVAALGAAVAAALDMLIEMLGEVRQWASLCRVIQWKSMFLCAAKSSFESRDCLTRIRISFTQ